MLDVRPEERRRLRSAYSESRLQDWKIGVQERRYRLGSEVVNKWHLVPSGVIVLPDPSYCFCEVSELFKIVKSPMEGPWTLYTVGLSNNVFPRGVLLVLS